MGIMRRLFSVGTGLAAGLLAYKLINRYEKKIQLEGEYRVIAPKRSRPGPKSPRGMLSPSPKPGRTNPRRPRRRRPAPRRAPAPTPTRCCGPSLLR